MAGGRVVDPHSVIGGLRKGPGDPAYVFDPARRTVWRATRTPDGPVLLRLTPYAGGEVEAEAWGPGAAWALDGVPELLGEADSWDGFEPLPEHQALVDAARRFPHFRVPRTRAVFEAMAAAGIEQVVTGKEAFRGWRVLLREYGEPAPGPSASGRPDDDGAAVAGGVAADPVLAVVAGRGGRTAGRGWSITAATRAKALGADAGADRRGRDRAATAIAARRRGVDGGRGPAAGSR